MEEVLPGPVAAGVRHPGAIEEVLVVGQHDRRDALGKRVDRRAAPERGERRGIVAGRIETESRQERRQVEQRPGLPQRGNVVGLELHDVG